MGVRAKPVEIFLSILVNHRPARALLQYMSVHPEDDHMSYNNLMPFKFIVILASLLFILQLQAEEKNAETPAADPQLEQLQNMTLDEKAAYWQKRRQEHQPERTP